eukprot:CAMPEP_0204052334 /NCGR_PEP_ID=MMETSP0360-20130528/124288_1 /ASSEMBLY_ACC=CAM_ASM_000342 /TAXON_ID=268821 /ORGANISM="Scrippsiella Hangoei, Strain SHTV-5" /LENGTH=38 /DNA_ID= /DNA_START= /DNA_END= /DNA_ORIENTATION=
MRRNQMQRGVIMSNRHRRPTTAANTQTGTPKILSGSEF